MDWFIYPPLSLATSGFHTFVDDPEKLYILRRREAQAKSWIL
jgi:hypothetical protein